jgi:hypothetical protein
MSHLCSSSTDPSLVLDVVEKQEGVAWDVIQQLFLQLLISRCRRKSEKSYFFSQEILNKNVIATCATSLDPSL